MQVRIPQELRRPIRRFALERNLSVPKAVAYLLTSANRVSREKPSSFRPLK